MDKYGYYILIISASQIVFGWHDQLSGNNKEYHCWHLNASASNPTPFDHCEGAHMDWVEAPPDQIEQNTPFNVSYHLTITDPFWPWAVQNEIFKNTEPSLDSTNATAIEAWCVGNQCSDAGSAGTSSCCVHHVNVHSCPSSNINASTGGICGPWIPNTGKIFTHSAVMVGNIEDGTWHSHVAGLHVIGPMSIIAHFKVGRMHFALHKLITVIEMNVCGDDVCELDMGESCSTCPADCGTCPLPAYALALIALVVVAVLAGVVTVVVYLILQKRRMQKLLWDESWIIQLEEITFKTDRRSMLSSAKTLKAMGSMIGSMLSVENTDKSRNSVSGDPRMITAHNQMFAETALWQGKVCAVKKIRKENFSLTKATRLEVREIRNVQDHQNICKFVAASLEPNLVHLLTEYCPKGSLADVLQNDEVALNWSFRFSFANDVACGLAHLHTHKMVHGAVKSNNCVIDDRWTVKLTDFGLSSLRSIDSEKLSLQTKLDQQNQVTSDRVYLGPEGRDSGWTSPEMDVYAYGILLVEIATRSDPFGDETWDSVPAGWQPPLPCTGGSGEDDCPCPKQYNLLVSSCWSEKPTSRPTCEQIKRTIQRINPSKKSPVDLMMSMMEKYSKQLESLVAERTADLVIEKQKTDKLLYSMLPRQVADELRQGRTVDAQEFSTCTIYFSDIVGFTSLSGRSTPFQVVALLNKLYICFDEIIDKYQVYKVETIGDAYMVVSGVPTVIGDEHAGEICKMAHDLVDACLSFEIPHLPGEPLKIRVGAHSGCVCAGVVGSKMPRYCLFGDTVNTASRMESNGEPYRIHISSYTYDYLQKLGGFSTELRGTIPVKGKGDMTTYWLTGVPNRAPSAVPELLKSPARELPRSPAPASPERSPKSPDLTTETVVQPITQHSPLVKVVVNGHPRTPSPGVNLTSDNVHLPDVEM